MLPLISPTLLAFLAIATLFLIALFMLDRRRSVQTKRAESLMRAFVLQHAMKSFCVVVDANDNPAEIAKLIQHLKSADYKQLQVLITVGKNIRVGTVRDLRKLQRLHKATIKVTVARYSSDATRRSAIKRYAKTDILMWLNAGERLSKNALKQLSVEFIDDSVDAVALREAPAVNDSVRSASFALDVIARQMFTQFGTSSDTPRVITKSAFITSKVDKTVSLNRASIITPYLSKRSMHWLPAAAALTATITIAVASAIMLPTGWQLISAAIYCLSITVVGLQLFSYPYVAVKKISMLLLLPLWPVVSSVITFIRHLRSLVRYAISRLMRLATLRKKPAH